MLNVSTLLLNDALKPATPWSVALSVKRCDSLPPLIDISQSSVATHLNNWGRTYIKGGRGRSRTYVPNFYPAEAALKRLEVTRRRQSVRAGFSVWISKPRANLDPHPKGWMPVNHPYASPCVVTAPATERYATNIASCISRYLSICWASYRYFSDVYIALQLSKNLNAHCCLIA